MKDFRLLYVILVALTSSLNLFFATAADGDFGSWVLTKDGHSGMNATKLTFEEKNLTLEFWLNVDDVEGRNIDGTNIISNRHDGNKGFSVSFYKNSANNNKVDIRFFFKNSTSDGTASDQVFTMYLPREAFANKWEHLAFVVSSTEKKAYSYLNGELYGVIEDFYTNWIGNHTTGDLCIGYWYESPKFYGKMADIRIWNKARTADEIAENYNKQLTGSEAGLQVYYNFNSFGQTIANAANTGKNTGYLLPSATWSQVHSYEVLAQKPVFLTVVNEQLTWTANGESWEIEVRSKKDNSLLNSGTVTEKSFSLAGLDKGFIVKIRTFANGVYSAWATIEDGIRVACIGDSNTYGAGASDRSKYAWPVQIRSMLGNDYTTVNLGKSGALMMNGFNDSWTNSSFYDQNKTLNPDIMLIALGTNDSKDGYWNVEKFKNSYTNLMNEFKTYPANPEIYMITPIKAYGTDWSINDETIRAQVIPAMKEMAKEMALPLIDTYVVTNDMANLVPDRIHPNDKGLEIIARKIADIMLLGKPRIEITDNPVTSTYAAYYWYKNNVLIDDANAVSYTATGTGSYKVAVKLTSTADDVIVSEPVEVTQANMILSAVSNSTSAVIPGINKLSIVPFSGYVQVTDGAGGVLSFYDSIGRLISTFKLKYDKEFISTTSLTKGLYICKVHKGDTVITTKILK